MNTPDFDPQRLEDLLLIAANQSPPEAERAELNAMLRHSAAARVFAARSLTFDSLLTESLKAAETKERHAVDPQAARPAPIEVDFKRRNWLARAALWIGGFHLFGNTAEAAATAAASKGTALTQSTIVLLMKKTATSITTAILVLGGSGIYAIHHGNESGRTRVAAMEAEILSLSDQLGIKTTGIANRRTGTTHSQRTVGITQVMAIYEGDNVISSQESAVLGQFREQLAAMDAESLANLLLDAEKISSPINGRVAEMIMKELILKSPADATRIASQLILRGSEFQFLLSSAAADAFGAWLAKDPAAADAWYVATAAAGGMGGRSIAANGLEDQAIDRSFARLRFAALVGSSPSEAAAMLATMLPGDVTGALKTVTDPDVLRQILPALRPEQKGPAAHGVIKAMAVNDIDAAFAWADSLGMGDRERDALMASGIEAAVAGGKLDLPRVAELSRNLDLDANRRSEMLVAAAKGVSLIPRKNEHVIEVDNSVYWDRVAERIDWLRKEAPADSADKMVGDYLGGLSYESRNLRKSLEAYENEVSRQGGIDPDLTVAFAFHLSLSQDDSMTAAALELLKKLPPGGKRDHAIETIELNR